MDETQESTGTEDQFLENYNPKEYPSVAVTVDVVVLTIEAGELSVLLVQRKNHPFKDAWALPGGFKDITEDLDDAAFRELAEETGVHIVPSHIEQLKSYGAPNRDPRMPVVTVAYLAFTPYIEVDDIVAGSDAAAARLWPVSEVLNDKFALAFDHEQIIKDGVERARAKLEYTSLATSFLPRQFTLSMLRKVYEAVWGTKLDPANFTRKVTATEGFVTEVDVEQPKGPGRPARLFEQTGDTATLHPPLIRSE